MKKVALVSCYYKHNYGSALQAYALQEVLLKNGVKCENIEISANKDFVAGKKKYYKSEFLNFKLYKAKFGMLKMRIGKRLFNGKITRGIRKREACFKRFENNFYLSKKYTSYAELGKAVADGYTDIIVGSDQLWLPVNVVSGYFSLSFAGDSVNKISYATSVGVEKVPEKHKKLYSDFLKKIDRVSVREESAKRLLKEEFGVDSELVADPALLLKKEEWLKKISNKPIAEGDYIFCYFLGKDKRKWKFAKVLSEKIGAKIVAVNNCDEYDVFGEKTADEVLYDIDPFDWINLINNAKYVCTDSYHGTAFSVLLNKNFFSFGRYSARSEFSTNGRISGLLERFGLGSRVVTLDENGYDLSDIDYVGINEELAEFRSKSLEFLLGSLKYEVKAPKTVADLSKGECCGCTACKHTCPVEAITMTVDGEGFSYPSVSTDKCVSCGRCIGVCPVVNSEKRYGKQRAFLVQNQHEEILKKSTSGGAFSAIAERIIKEGGEVIGASFNEDFSVSHTFAEKREELGKFRGSKYVQSDLGEVFLTVKAHLDEGKKVLFSGTPCQVEGLIRYLGGTRDNLVTVDFVCHAIPSPAVWKKYLEYVSDGKEIKEAYFRSKDRYGYEYPQMKIIFDGGVYENGVETDPYLRGYFSDITDRPCCYECAFKKRFRMSDITVWDCFDVGGLNKDFDDNRGVSRVLVHTDKGQATLNGLQNCKIVEISPEAAVRGAKELTESVGENPIREKFFKDFETTDSKELFSRYFPQTPKIKFERTVRRISSRLGLYGLVRRIAKKLARKG